MQVEEIKVLNEDERGIMYDCDKLKFIEKKKGTINANHEHDVLEILYLVKDEAKLTIGKETRNVKAPVKIKIPANVYHKLIAITEIILLEDR